MIVNGTKKFKLVVITIAFLIVLQILCPMFVKANSDTETLTLNTDQIVMAVSQNSNEGRYVEVISPDGVEISNWEIKDTTIAEATKVNSRKLLITPKKVGDTVITVTGSNGATAECIIGVDNFDEDESSNGLTLNTDQIVMAVSQNSNEGRYVEVISPDGVEILNWEIKDITIAEATKVNSRKLLITPKKVGDTVITITGSNGATAECIIGVDNFDEDESTKGLTLNTDQIVMAVSQNSNEGRYVEVISPDGVEISNWEIKDTTIAEATKVNSRKLLITPKKVGDTVIIVTGSNGATAECIIGVDNFDEEQNKSNKIITDSTLTSKSKLPKAGVTVNVIIIIIAIAIICIISLVLYKKYKNIDK